MEIIIGRLHAGSKVTPQDLQLFIDGLERREHALKSRLAKVTAGEGAYTIPESLRQKLLSEILFLETDHNTKAKVEQVMAKHASMLNILKKLEVIIQDEKYKIKVHKPETSEN